MGEEAKPSEDRWGLLQRLEFIANIICQMCIGFVTIYMSWLCLRVGLKGTALHAWLVTIGFSFLMAEGIMCHYDANALTFSYKRYTKTTVHWVLQVMGGGMGVAGAIIQLDLDKLPLFSLHGKLGFSAFILCWVSMLTGLFSLFAKRFYKITTVSPLLNKSFHNFLGMSTFVLALSAQFYGYDMDILKYNTTADFQILIKCVTLVALILTCIGPLKALYQKLSSAMS